MCSWSHAHWQKVDFLSEYMCFLSAVVSNQLALTKRIAGWACKAFSLVNAIGKGTNGLVLRSLVGAALIKKYSSYRTYPKKNTRVFFPKLVRGDLKSPPDGWQTLLPSSAILSISFSANIAQYPPPWHWMRNISTTCSQFWLHSGRGATFPHATVEPESWFFFSPR
jgi:hypothetical protein